MMRNVMNLMKVCRVCFKIQMKMMHKNAWWFKTLSISKIDRNHSKGHKRLYWDYLTEYTIYDKGTFSRRFRATRASFLSTVCAVSSVSNHFLQEEVCADVRCLSSLQKYIPSIYMLAYSGAADQLDEYLRVRKRIKAGCLIRLCKAILKFVNMSTCVIRLMAK